MKQAIRLTLMTAALLAPAVTFAQGGTQTKSGQMGSMGVQLPPSDKDFAERLHMSNQQEIAASKMAVQKAQTPEVRQFAQMLVDDHTKADQQLMQMAQQNKMKLGQPKFTSKEKKLQAAQKATMDKLQVEDGLAFEQSYLSAMVERHDHIIAKVQMAQEQYKNSKLQPMFSQLIPTLSQHREKGYELLGQVSSTKQMGVGGAGQSGMGSGDEMGAGHEMGGSGAQGTGGSGQQGSSGDEMEMPESKDRPMEHP